jgi:hypothetical protein
MGKLHPQTNIERDGGYLSMWMLALKTQPRLLNETIKSNMPAEEERNCVCISICMYGHIKGYKQKIGVASVCG